MGPGWSSTGKNKHPPQTRWISDIRTRKSVGENLEPKPKPADPKSMDIRPEPDPLPSLFHSTTSLYFLLIVPFHFILTERINDMLLLVTKRKQGPVVRCSTTLWAIIVKYARKTKLKKAPVRLNNVHTSESGCVTSSFPSLPC